MKLRSYQQEAVDGVISHWLGGGGAALVVLPTGAGKSLVLAELVRVLHTEHEANIAVLTHVSQLIKQNVETLLRIWPDAPVGVNSAGLGMRQSDEPIIFGGIQSCYKSPPALGQRHVVIIDEAHLLNPRQEGMYGRYLQWQEENTPGFRLCGLTATPFRMSTGRLDEDYGDHKALFEKTVIDIPITRLIEEGYLSPLKCFTGKERLDVTGVRTSGGDYNLKQLGEAVDKEDVNTAVVDQMIKAGADRKTWLVFATSVDHAHHLGTLLRERGVVTEVVTGDTPEDQRQAAYDGAREGRIKALVGMNVMTTGLDIPNVDMIAMVRPTKSLGLWIQMLGRGTRKAPGKEDCLLIDFSPNVLTFGPIDEAHGHKEKTNAKGNPYRSCPECDAVVHISKKSCPNCNHEFPKPVNIMARPNAGKLFSGYDPIWHDVDYIEVARHSKRFGSGPDSMRVTYRCGLLAFSTWVALEHPTASGFARQWWRKHTGGTEAPETVAEALARQGEIRTPGRIKVTREGKFDKIVDYDYGIESRADAGLDTAVPQWDRYR